MSAFTEWLRGELAARRWSYQDLADNAGLSKGAVGVVMSQRQNPGLALCRGVAQAFQMPPENVLRQAGLLPGGPAPESPDFVDWLKAELLQRRWGYHELARRAALSSGGVSLVMSRRQTPGFEFVAQVARAFGYPIEDLLVRAGLLPPRPAAPELAEYQALWAALGPDAQEIVLILMRGLQRRAPQEV